MKKTIIAMVMGCTMMSGQASADYDQSYIFSDTTAAATDLALLSTLEMQETEGEFIPALGVIISIIGVDLALAGYFYGVYIPTLTRYAEEIKRLPKRSTQPK